MSESWIEVCKLNDIPPLGAQRLKVGGTQIGVFRAEGDLVFAIEDVCPHKQGPLTQGIVHGACVTCPLHNWVINLASGEVEGVDEGSVGTFPVTVSSEGVIHVQLPEGLIAANADKQAA